MVSATRHFLGEKNKETTSFVKAATRSTLWGSVPELILSCSLRKACPQRRWETGSWGSMNPPGGQLVPL